ncbi:MAG: cyclase family protein [Fusobacteriota bacterium]
MKTIDLTYEIYPDMPIHPVMEQPVFKKMNTIDKDGFRESKLQMYSHTGTHMDAPAHMIDKGKYLEEFTVGHFMGKAFMVDFCDRNQQHIEISFLKKYKEKIKNAEFLIINTGWSEYWGNPRYYEGFPYLTDEAAKWLTKFDLKGVGIDTISIDGIKSTRFNVHKILLKENIVIVENLENLELIDSHEFIFSAMPLKIKKADGAPVRAIAIKN